tara:strand:- start:123 stop:446 length:324 start_codon:yes stop_codon:yes gene_type:complete
MKLTRYEIRKIISEVLTVNEGIDDLGYINTGLLKAGLGKLDPKHADAIRDFLNNELKITNDEFNKIAGMKDELKPLYDKYVKDIEEGRDAITEFINGLRDKLKEFIG